MAPKFTEEEIDDLLYFARVGEQKDFDTLCEELCSREHIAVPELLQLAIDESSKNTALHMAAANGHHTLLRHLTKLLSNPSPQNPTMLQIINAHNESGNTALHWAAINGHLESVKVLLEEGADPTLQNHRGHDAVYEAELNDKMEVVEWVLKEGGEGLEQGFGGGVGEGENMVQEEGEGAGVEEEYDEAVMKDGEEIDIGMLDSKRDARTEFRGESGNALKEKLDKMDIEDNEKS